MNTDAINQLLTLNHEIRQTESHLKIARRRRRLSNVSFIFGPVLLAILYGVWWIPKLNHHIVLIIGAPLVLIALLSSNRYSLTEVHTRRAAQRGIRIRGPKGTRKGPRA